MGAGNFFDRILPKPRPAWRTAALVYVVPSLLLYELNSLRPDYNPIAIRMAVLQFFNAYLALAVLLYLGYRHKDRRSLVAAWGLIAVMLIGFIRSMGTRLSHHGLCGGMALGAGLQVRWVVLIAAMVINPVRTDSATWRGWTRTSPLWRRSHPGWGLEPGFRGCVSSRDIQPGRTSRDGEPTNLILAQAIDYVPEQVYNRGDGMGISTSLGSQDSPQTGVHGSPFQPLRCGVRLLTSKAHGLPQRPPGVRRMEFWRAGVLSWGSWRSSGPLLGHNGRRGDASTLASIILVGLCSCFSLALAIPAAVTFAAGVLRPCGHCPTGRAC